MIWTNKPKTRQDWRFFTMLMLGGTLKPPPERKFGKYHGLHICCNHVSSLSPVIKYSCHQAIVWLQCWCFLHLAELLAWGPGIHCRWFSLICSDGLALISERRRFNEPIKIKGYLFMTWVWWVDRKERKTDFLTSTDFLLCSHIFIHLKLGCIYIWLWGWRYHLTSE